jgi:hypothetical protein
MSKTVYDHRDITIFWNQGVHMERDVLAVRPDIIIKSKKDKICFMTDAAKPLNRNVI